MGARCPERSLWSIFGILRLFEDVKKWNNSLDGRILRSCTKVLGCVEMVFMGDLLGGDMCTFLAFQERVGRLYLVSYLSSRSWFFSSTTIWSFILRVDLCPSAVS
jgi:hypothetical protein